MAGEDKSNDDGIWNFPFDVTEKQQELLEQEVGEKCPPAARFVDCITIDLDAIGNMTGQPDGLLTGHDVDYAGDDRTRMRVMIAHGTTKRQIMEMIYRLAQLVDGQWERITGELRCTFKVNAKGPDNGQDRSK